MLFIVNFISPINKIPKLQYKTSNRTLHERVNNVFWQLGTSQNLLPFLRRKAAI